MKHVPVQFHGQELASTFIYCEVAVGIRACKTKALKEKSADTQMSTSGRQEQKATHYSKTNIVLRDTLGGDPLRCKNTQEQC